MSKVLRKLALGSLVAALMAGTASADTLRERALHLSSNPTIPASASAARTDASRIARAAGRPQARDRGLNRDLSRIESSTRRQAPTAVGSRLSYPLFNGGRAATRPAAETRVEAGRATLRAVEGDVFTEAVAAYMDVIRDRAIVELNANNVRVLTTNLEATRDRFEIGDLTRTDVAQSEARLQLGRSNLALAQGQLTGSEENYRRVIGKRPDALAPPPPLPPFPATPGNGCGSHSPTTRFDSVTRQASALGFDVRSPARPGSRTVSSASAHLRQCARRQRGPAAEHRNPDQRGLNARIPLYRAGPQRRGSARPRRSKASFSSICLPPDGQWCRTPARRSPATRRAECDRLQPRWR